MGLFSRIFGGKQDGSALLDESLSRLHAVATPIDVIRLMAQTLERKHQQFTVEGQIGFATSSVGEFKKSASVGAQFARKTMANLRENRFDMTSLDDVEIYVILTVLNQLLVAETISNQVTAEHFFEGALDWTTSDIGKELELIMQADDLFNSSLMVQRSTSVKSEYAQWLRGHLLPQLPTEIVAGASALIRELRA